MGVRSTKTQKYWPQIWLLKKRHHRFPGGSDGKASARNAGDPGSIPGLGRSPGEGNGNPLQYSCLGNSIPGGLWSMGSQRVRHDNDLIHISLSGLTVAPFHLRMGHQGPWGKRGKVIVSQVSKKYIRFPFLHGYTEHRSHNSHNSHHI